MIYGIFPSLCTYRYFSMGYAIVYTKNITKIFTISLYSNQRMSGGKSKNERTKLKNLI